MARAHWRFVVRDQQGFVIQNARVFVYQPNTTTVFTGTAYTAASGGSSTTNPFTTNSQGEVEAWFDTPQVVDVNVTDNTDQAYRASTGEIANFSSFTEADDIYYAGSEVQSTNPHGIADHTNVVRSFFLKAEDATLGTGAAFVTVGSGLNISRTVEYSDAASEDASWTFNIPTDFFGSAVTVQPVWEAGTTDASAHTVRWVYTAKALTNGVDVTAAGTTTTWTGASAARTANILVYDTLTSTGVTPVSGDIAFLLNVQRLGSDGADTYVGAVRLHGLFVTYTASQ